MSFFLSILNNSRWTRHLYYSSKPLLWTNHPCFLLASSPTNLEMVWQGRIQDFSRRGGGAEFNACDKKSVFWWILCILIVVLPSKRVGGHSAPPLESAPVVWKHVYAKLKAINMKNWVVFRYSLAKYTWAWNSGPEKWPIIFSAFLPKEIGCEWARVASKRTKIATFAI